MPQDDRKQKVLTKLVNARNELEDASNLSTPAARYDPVVLADARRRELSVMVDDLNHVIRQLEDVP